MRTYYRQILNLLLVWVLGIVAPQAAMAAPGVRDDAAVFSSRTVRQADDAARMIQKQLHKELLVETFAGIPEGRSEEYARNREEFFSNLVRDRARSAQLDGIYVLVMKEPPPHRFRIQVGVGPATREKAFLTSNRDELVRIFQSSFREDRFDEGLQNGVAYVERTLRANLRPSAAAGTPSASPNGSWETAAATNEPSSRGSIGSFLLLGVLLLGGILLVRFLFRMMRGSQGGQLAGAGGMGGRGGGFLTSLLGGIGGVMAGSWLYDRFMGGNAHASDSSMTGPSDNGASDVGGDFSSSGGDVDFGGGGDFGGDGGGGGDA
ncbi:MAG: TPM domain-containing protein [Verrucomicrobiales bacterium]|nr:TPM domain-containing protein [Verrucomicrobiales bacterium]